MKYNLITPTSVGIGILLALHNCLQSAFSLSQRDWKHVANHDVVLQ